MDCLMDQLKIMLTSEKKSLKIFWEKTTLVSN